MVKVIGIDDKYRYKVTHTGCGSILEYFENEVIKSTYTDYSGCTDPYHYIVCPTCHPSNSDLINPKAKVEVTDRKRS